MRRLSVIPVPFALLLLLALACGSPETGQQEASADEATPPGGEPEATEAAGGPEEQALAQLNEMCPENWCAGDFQYQFQSLVCEGEECTLGFHAERDGEEFQDSVRFAYDAPLVDEFGDLDATYWERVNDALTEEWEPTQGAE